MTFTTLQKRFQRPSGDILRLIKGMDIGGRRGFSNREVYKDFYSRDDALVIQEYLDWKKEDYIQYIREYLYHHPFASYQDITDLIARPASYTQWILTEMSYSEADLAETDKSELFLVSDHTKKLLDERGDLW
jgi:hypothetical protein